MPWTFAHPAAVIPLRRYCPALLNFPALVIGSITPDLGYHVSRRDWSAFAHSLEGSLVACVPIGLLLLGGLCLLRNPLWYLLPQPHRDALAPLAAAKLSFDFRVLLAAAASIVLGAWTHIAWDAFTHSDGWVVLRVALLQQSVFEVGGFHFYFYNLLQHLSTCLGVVILAAAYRRWLRREQIAGASPYSTRNEAWRYRMLALVGVAAFVIGVALAAHTAAQFHGSQAWRVFVVRGAIDGMSALVGLYLLCSLLCYRARETA